MDTIRDMLTSAEWAEAHHLDPSVCSEAELLAKSVTELLEFSKLLLARLYMDKVYVEMPGACLGSREYADIVITARAITLAGKILGHKLFGASAEAVDDEAAMKAGTAEIERHWGGIIQATEAELSLWRARNWNALYAHGCITAEDYQAFVAEELEVQRRVLYGPAARDTSPWGSPGGAEPTPDTPGSGEGFLQELDGMK